MLTLTRLKILWSCGVRGTRTFFSSTFIKLQQTRCYYYSFKFISTVLAMMSVIASSVILLPPALILFSVLWLRRWLARWFVSLTTKDATFPSTPSLWGAPQGCCTSIVMLTGHLHARDLMQLFQNTDCNGRGINIFLKHPNLKKRIAMMHGVGVWLKCSSFDVADHIQQAPSHYHHSLVTSRNIQEYVSTLLHQSSMSPNLPPWQVFVINGTEPDCSKVTWLLIRAHHLLTDEMLLDNTKIKTHFEPWGSEGTFPLLTAPSASKRFFGLILKNVVPVCLRLSKYIQHALGRVKDGLSWLICYVQTKYHVREPRPCQIVSANGININTDPLSSYKSSSLRSLSNFSKITLLSMHIVNITCTNTLYYIFNVITHVCRIIVSAVVWCKRIQTNRTTEEQMLLEALVEIYWIIRAIISLPRLLMEELIDTWRAEPLQVWKGSRRPHNLRVTWGDGITSKLVDDIRSATGASSSSVLLTAASMAVTDVLKAAGVPRPNVLRCTVPVSAGSYSDETPNHSTEFSETSCNKYYEASNISANLNVKSVTSCSATLNPSTSSVNCFPESTNSVNSTATSANFRKGSFENHRTATTLLPLDFPTGVSNSIECLKSVRHSFRNLRRYPERYLVSTWLLRYGYTVLPKNLLMQIVRVLTGRYPLLCTYITAPDEPISFLGSLVTGMFHLRHPVHQAVLSLCVTRYCGAVTVGAQTSDWTCPYADVLPRSFESCISELAVSSGVRIQPKRQLFSTLPFFGGSPAMLRSLNRGCLTPSSPKSPTHRIPSFPKPQSVFWEQAVCNMSPINEEYLIQNISHEGRSLYLSSEASFGSESVNEDFNRVTIRSCNTKTTNVNKRKMFNNLKRQLDYSNRIAEIQTNVRKHSLISEVFHMENSAHNICKNDTENSDVRRNDTELLVFDASLARRSIETKILDSVTSGSKVLEFLHLNENITYRNSTMPSI